MFVSRNYAARYHIRHRVVVQGYVQVLTFIPDNHSIGPPLSKFSIFNVYLPSGNDSVVQTKRLSILKTMQEPNNLWGGPPMYTIAGGDWNLTESAADSNSRDHFASSQLMREALTSFLKSYKLHEVFQPHHTRFSNSTRGESSSRLDRFYVSHSAIDCELMTPLAILPPHPHLPESNTRISDHFPVKLLFLELNPGINRFRIPDWIAKHPDFLAKVRTQYSASPKPHHPVKRIVLFKKIVRKTARQCLSTVRTEAKTRAAALTVGYGILRAIKKSNDTTKALRLANSAPPLLATLRDDLDAKDLQLLRLQAHIADILKTNTITSASNLKPTPFLKSAKENLPQSKTLLTSRSHLGKRYGNLTVWPELLRLPGSLSGTAQTLLPPPSRTSCHRTQNAYAK